MDARYLTFSQSTLCRLDAPVGRCGLAAICKLSKYTIGEVRGVYSIVSVRRSIKKNYTHNSKTMDVDKSELGAESMGFKDKEKALFTLKYLEGRDVTYQFRAIQNYHARARKILKITKDKDKVKNITEAMDVFAEWMRDYRENDRGKTNWPYLSIETIEAFRPLAKIYGIYDDDFYNKYKETNGNYAALRTTKTDDGKTTWDIERNRRLKEMINDKADKTEVDLYETENEARKGYPTKEHLRFILLGFSPDPSKLKALVAKMPRDSEPLKSNDEKMEVTEESRKEQQRNKRSRESPSSDESSEENEEPSKKKSREFTELTSDEKKKQQQELGSSGLSFKDKDRALKSIESMEGRDVSYQYHALAGLIKRAARVISCTKDEQKIRNMREAVEVFENWITDYNANHRSRENFGYLTLDIVRAYRPLAAEYGIEVPEFVKAYEQVDGDYKKLRSVVVPRGETTWDIERNKRLRPIVDVIKERHILWFETDAGKLRGLPTKEHTECIMWGYSADPAKLKKILPQLREKLDATD